MIIEIMNFINLTILMYFIILSLGYIFLLTASVPQIFKRFKETEVGNIIAFMKSYSLPPVTVIIPAYNEEQYICETIDSILKNDYSNTFIIIVNDGSTDQTLQKLIATYSLNPVHPIVENKIKTTDTIKGYYVSQLYKNITVIDKAHTDRSDTLNIGVNVCRTPLLMTMDADTLIERDGISGIVFYMLSRPNTIAAGGGVYILNGCRFKNGQIIETRMSTKPLYAFQTCEYLRSFLFNRSGWNALGGALSYAGAFTAFKHASVVEMGGYEVGNLAQDFEIITHLQANYRERKISYNIGYTPSAVVWTDVPGTLKEYWRQRYHWQYSTLQSLLPYKKCFLILVMELSVYLLIPFSYWAKR